MSYLSLWTWNTTQEIWILSRVWSLWLIIRLCQVVKVVLSLFCALTLKLSCGSEPALRFCLLYIENFCAWNTKLKMRSFVSCAKKVILNLRCAITLQPLAVYEMCAVLLFVASPYVAILSTQCKESFVTCAALWLLSRFPVSAAHFGLYVTLRWKRHNTRTFLACANSALWFAQRISHSFISGIPTLSGILKPTQIFHSPFNFQCEQGSRLIMAYVINTSHSESQIPLGSPRLLHWAAFIGIF